MNINSSNLDNLLNEAIYESFRNNILNLYHGQERQTLNPNRLPLSLLRNNLSSRYYNSPPQGGYHVNEEHEYDIDLDDISSLIFLDITTRFASPVDNKTIRKEKIKEIKYRRISKNS